MIELDELNVHIAELLSKLAELPAESVEADELVSNLQVVIGQRQFLLSSLIASASAEDRGRLQQQLEITLQFEKQAVTLMEQRRELLSLESKSKRQINIYKTIDADR
ncbi:hypothetical protein [Shewanella cyperi]|uniref:hypothetical protein n=1 Tax=Shewanella cyperi TaxID=2814292 RepID=UPI001A94AA30|nr:hypothetical protein [Shewanella cyperi]QSX39687.1 hypothetical protein JYB84_11740 [Shewanella cyperi]